MKNLINYLTEVKKILICHLNENSVFKDEKIEMENYMGICKVREKYRRIDIKLFPKEEYGTALLHFTGSDYFNRNLRMIAK